VTASYKFKDDGKNIQILNKAVNVDDDGVKVETTEGNAEVMRESQFKVRFGDQTTGGRIGLWFQNLDKGPNYYILNAWTDSAAPDSGYKIALVTNGKKWLDIITDIWILASTPTITEEEMQTALEYARKAGYNPEKSYFEKTPCTAEQRLLLP
jgi:lipocalin